MTSRSNNVFISNLTTDKIQVNSSLINNKELVSKGPMIVENTLSVLSDTDIGGQLTVHNAAYVDNLLSVHGPVYVQNETLFNLLNVRDVYFYLENTYFEQYISVAGGAYSSYLGVKNVLDVSTNYLSLSQPFYLSNYMSVSGKSSFVDNVYLTNNLSINGTNFINGDLSVNQNTYIQNFLSINQGAYLNSLISIESNATFNDDVSIGGRLTIFDRLSIGDEVYLQDTLSVLGDTTLQGTLSIQYDSYLKSKLSVFSDVNLSKTLSVSDIAYLSNKLSVGGNVHLSNDLSVFGYSYFNSGLSVYEPSYFNDTLSISDIVYINNKLSVHDNVYIDYDLSVGTDSYLKGILSVYDNITFQNTISINQNTYLSNALSIFGNTNINNTLSIAGISYFTNKLSVFGDTNITNSLSISGILYEQNQMSIAGLTTINNRMSISGTIFARDALSILNNATITSNISVGNTVYISGKLSIQDNIGTYADLSIAGSGYIQSKLSVFADSNFQNTLSIGGNTYLRNKLSVFSNANFTNTVSINLATNIGSSLSILGPFTNAGILSVFGKAYLNDNLSVSGTQYLQSKLSVFGDTNIRDTLSVSSNVYIASKLSISGDTNIKDSLSIAGIEYIQNQLSVFGQTTLNDKLSINGRTFISETLSISGIEYIQNQLSVFGRTTLNNILSVNGRTFISDALSVSGIEYIQNQLSVFGQTTLNNILSVNGRTFIAETLSVANNVYLQSKLSISGDTNIKDTLSVSSNVYIASKLSISGDTNIKDSLSVAGIEYIQNQLSVFGQVTLNDKLSVNGRTFIADTLSVSGIEYIQNQLSIFGRTTLNNILSVNGRTFIADTLSISNNTYIQSKLSVYDSTTLNNLLSVNGPVYMNATLSVNQNLTLSNDISVQGAGYVRSSLSLNGGLTVVGDINMLGSFFQNGILQSTNSSSIWVLGPNNSLYYLAGNVGIGTIDPQAKLDVSGKVIFNNTLSVGDTLFLNNSLSIYNDSTIRGTVSIFSPLTLQNTVSINGETTLNNSLDVSGIVRINNNLSVNGPVNMNTTLSVNGPIYIDVSNVILKNNLSIDGQVTVRRQISVFGLTLLRDGLSVQRDACFVSSLSVAGNAHFNSRLTVSNATFLNNILSVNSNVNFNNNLTVNSDSFLKSNLSVTGNLTLGQRLDCSSVYLTQILSVNNQTYLNNKLDVSGNITLYSSLSVFNRVDLSGVFIKNNLSVNKQTYLNDNLDVSGITTLYQTLSINGNTTISNNLSVFASARSNITETKFIQLPWDASSSSTMVQVNNDLGINNVRIKFGGPNSEIHDLLLVHGQSGNDLTVRGLGTGSRVKIQTNSIDTLIADQNQNVLITNKLSINNSSNIGGNLYVSANSYLNQTVAVNKNFTLPNFALDVSGNANISGNIHLGGNLFVDGSSIQINTQGLTITDGVIGLASDNLYDDMIPIGFLGNYYNFDTLDVTSAGIVREPGTKNWWVFNNLSVTDYTVFEPVDDYLKGNIIVDLLNAHNLSVSSDSFMNGSISISNNFIGNDSLSVSGFLIGDGEYIRNVSRSRYSKYATTSNLIGTYDSSNNFTISSSTLSIDGNLVSVGDTILLKNQNLKFQNGLYYVNTIDNIGNTTLLVRPENFRDSEDFNVGTIVFVLRGNLNARTAWVISGVTDSFGYDLSGNSINVGDSLIYFNQINWDNQNIYLENNLSVYSDSFFNSKLSVFDSVIIQNNLSIENGIIDASSLSVFGTTTLSSTLSVSGNTTISGVLKVINNQSLNQLLLDTGNGASSRVSNIRFNSTFFNLPSDTLSRRTADITAGFTTGVWGTEYMSFNVGNNSVANDAANLTSEKIRILNSGNVGIGTTNPAQKLEVYQGRLRITGDTNTSSVLELVDGSLNSVSYLFNSAIDQNIYLYPSTNKNIILQTLENGNSNGGNIGIGTNNPQAFVHISKADNTDNVIIGSASGIYGNDSIWSSAYFKNFNKQVSLIGNINNLYNNGGNLVDPSGSVKLYVGQYNNDQSFCQNMYPIVCEDENGIVDFSIRACQGQVATSSITYVGGNLGIGTTNPSSRLHISSSLSGATNQLIRFATPNLGSSSEIIYKLNFGSDAFGSSDVTAAIGFIRKNSATNNASAIAFYNYNGASSGSDLTSETMRIDSNGNVGIGTTNPSSKLTILVSSASIGAMKLNNANSVSNDTWWIGFNHGTNSEDSNDRARIGVNIASTGAGRLIFTTGLAGSQTEKMRLDQSGILLLGMTTSPTLGAASTQMIIAKNNGYNNVSNGYYLGLGGIEYNTVTPSLSYRLIGLGYRNVTADTFWPAYMGYLTSSDAGRSKGHLVFGTRNITDDIEPSERMRITDAGNIGIGNTNPSVKLDISGGGTLLKLTGSNTVNESSIGFYPSSANTTYFKLGNGITNYIGETNFALFNGTNNTLSWWVNSSNQFIINGSVGIGTNNPVYKLVVSDGSNNAIADTNYATSYVPKILLKRTNPTIINTAASQIAGALVFQGTRSSIDTDVAYMDCIINNVGSGGNQIDGNLRFFTRPYGSTLTERMRIDSSGNVGIGTATPSRLLTIHNTSTTDDAVIGAFNGGAYASSLYGGRLELGKTEGGGYQPFGFIIARPLVADSGFGYMSFWTRNSQTMTERMRIDNNGNVGIGTADPGTNKLYVNGNTVINGTLSVSGNINTVGDITAFSSASDIRLKTNITSLSSSIEIVNSLNPVTFNWKNDIFNEEYRNKDDVGFIAQEVESVIPLAVSEFSNENETYKRIKHERMLPYIIKSIQELSDKINNHEKEIIKLKEENEILKSKLNIQ